MRVHTGEEEALQGVERGLSASAPSVVEHPVELLGRAVVAGVSRVAELVGVAVQRARRRQGLVRPAAVHHVHQIGLDPALDQVGVGVEAHECARIPGVLAGEVADREFVPAGRTARAVPAEPQPGEQHGQHAVHVERLEVDVAEFRQAKLAVASLQRHQPASASRAWSVRTPSGSRSIR